MSQYPYGYGQYPTHPPPFPPPNQYAYQNPAAYPPAPAYGSPQDSNAPPPNYYAMTQSAYDYNSSIPGIPGLGFGGTPLGGAAYHPPALPAWGHQPPVQQPDLNSQFTAGTLGDAPSQYHYSAPARFDGPADQSYPPPSYTSQQQPPQPVPQLSDAATQSSDEMEEGELSEGQFEDLYEPMDSSAKSKDTTLAPNVPSIPNESQPTSAADTPSGGFYTNEEDDPDSRNLSLGSTSAKVDDRVHNPNGRNEPTATRERTGSYSPYLSPREIQGASMPNNSGRSTQIHPKANGQVGPSALNGSGNGQVPGLGQRANDAPDTSNMSNTVPATKPATSRNPTANGNNNDNHHPFMPGYKSLAEAKKEAQKAILRLWPLGVKYQHYIDEGFDEKVVKLLFNELHLDMSTGKPIQPDFPQKPQQSQTDAQSSVPATSKPPIAERKVSPQSSTKPPQGDKMDKSEERKDRIARLLAEKAAKGPVATATATSAPAPAPAPASAEVNIKPQISAPAVVPASAPSPVVAQAHVPARTASPAPAPQGITHAQVPASLTATTQAPAPAQVQPPTGANPTMTAKSSATSTPTGPKPKTKEEIQRLLRQKMEALQKSRELGAQKVDADKTTSSPVKSGGAEIAKHGTAQRTTAVSAGLSTATATPQQQSNQDKGPIPGLFLSSASQAMQPINVRKRPVAADFVDYSSLELRKRPFGQERQTSSLVIDVSDGSDDEEMDIDMDMDSPTDTPLTLQRSNISDRKGPSLAEFPPLRDLSRRLVSSPAPSAHTPPGCPMSTQEKELLAKEKTIQEMKRKIAEFEAKKKAKRGSQTPNQATATPSDSESSGHNSHRASSVSVDKVDAPSAQLISEAVSAKIPQPSALGPKNTAPAERGRSVSHGVSRADSVLEEKKKKLAALREAQKTKIREAEARIKAEEARIREEEARLQEEEARLEAEFNGATEMEDGTDDGNQSEHMSIDEQPEEEASNDNEGRQNGDSPAVASSSPSLLETEEKPPSPILPTSTTGGSHEQAADAATEAQDVGMNVVSEPAIVDAGSSQADRLDKTHETASISAANNHQDPSAASQQQIEDFPTIEQVGVVEQVPDSSVSNATTEPLTASAGQPVQEAPSDSYTSAEAIATDSADRVDIPDSPEFSPEPAGNTAGHIDAQIGEESVPATISDVTRSRDDIQEIEGAATSEPKQPVAPQPNSSFVPYESPLRYFRAFKFHPEFNKFVPGGQKSLTYSNKIDPRKELCPSELQGGACARGEACEFQHLSSVGISDEQILVELGRADDYTGEQRDRFISGLRELLQDFRAKKVRDFDTIANGIIEFRCRFLGDKSKILPLEGVTL